MTIIKDFRGKGMLWNEIPSKTYYLNKNGDLCLKINNSGSINAICLRTKEILDTNTGQTVYPVDIEIYIIKDKQIDKRL